MQFKFENQHVVIRPLCAENEDQDVDGARRPSSASIDPDFYPNTLGSGNWANNNNDNSNHGPIVVTVDADFYENALADAGGDGGREIQLRQTPDDVANGSYVDPQLPSYNEAVSSWYTRVRIIIGI